MSFDPLSMAIVQPSSDARATALAIAASLVNLLGDLSDPEKRDDSAKHLRKRAELIGELAAELLRKNPQT